MNGIRLSICIPTYNFGRFIGATLESILPQLAPGVEVVVVDGASTDDTEAVVRAFRERCPALSYHRLERRGGIDRDMAKAVALARGEYCWLFSADDVMRPGVLGAVLGHLRSAHDVYLCGFTLCTLDMKALRDHPILALSEDREFELSDPGQRLRYFALARTTPAFFSFMGSLVFKRFRWEAQRLDERYVGSCWAHVARFLQMLPQGLRVKFLTGSFLYKRLGNDSFMDKGIAHRVAIGVEGYHRLALEFFGQDSPEASHIRRVVRNEYPAMALLARKLECLEQGGKAEAAELDRLAGRVFSDPSFMNWIQRCLYRATPWPLVRSAKTLHEMKKRLTAQEMPCT